MAYIDANTTKKIRQALKSEFPTVKFSVRKSDSIALYVSVIKSDLFEDGVAVNINHYYIERTDQLNEDQKTFLLKVKDVIETAGEYFDDSDSMTDYFHCAFYYHISVGTYDKPHQKI